MASLYATVAGGAISGMSTLRYDTSSSSDSPSASRSLPTSCLLLLGGKSAVTILRSRIWDIFLKDNKNLQNNAFQRIMFTDTFVNMLSPLHFSGRYKLSD